MTPADLRKRAEALYRKCFKANGKAEELAAIEAFAREMYAEGVTDSIEVVEEHQKSGCGIDRCIEESIRALLPPDREGGDE